MLRSVSPWALVAMVLLASSPAFALKPRCTEEPTANYMKQKVFKAKIAKDYGVTRIQRFTTTRKCFVVETVVSGQAKVLYFNPVTGEPVDLPDPPKDPFAKKPAAAQPKPKANSAG